MRLQVLDVNCHDKFQRLSWQLSGHKGGCATIFPLALGESYILDSPGWENRVTPCISLMAGKSSKLPTETDVIKIFPHIYFSPSANVRALFWGIGKADFLVEGLPSVVLGVFT